MKSFQGGHSKDKTSAWTVIANVVTGQLLRFHGSIRVLMSTKFLTPRKAPPEAFEAPRLARRLPPGGAPLGFSFHQVKLHGSPP
jgi:hypothetical protein